jgi:acylphosphatase
MKKTISIIIRGRVQGVFFRQATREKAREFGISGWVKNMPDGSVLIKATGESGMLEKLADWCRSGPPRAAVENILVSEEPAEDFKSFIIDR